MKVVQAVLMIFMVLCGNTVAVRKVVDLTHQLKEDSVKLPILPPMKIETNLSIDFEFNGLMYNAHANLLSVIEHYGTHLDAPSHFLNLSAPAGTQWTVTDIPPERLFFVPTRVIRLKYKAKRNRDYLVTVKDIDLHERIYGKIPAGSFVLFDFGWAPKFNDEKEYLGYDTEEDKNALRFHFPGLGEAAALKLLDRDITGVGADCISIDSGSAPQLVAHFTLLSKNILFLENIGDMSALPPTDVELIIGVMNVHKGTGAPVRLVAAYDDASLSNMGRHAFPSLKNTFKRNSEAKE